MQMGDSAVTEVNQTDHASEYEETENLEFS